MGEDLSVPNIVRWRNALLTAGERGPKPIIRLTLDAMAVRADNDTLEFFITQHEIAHWLGMSLRQVKRNISDALESGWLQQVEQGNSRLASTYRLTIGATDNPSGVIPAPHRAEASRVADDPVEDSATEPICPNPVLAEAKGVMDVTVKGVMDVTPTTPVTTPITTPIEIPSVRGRTVNSEPVSASANRTAVNTSPCTEGAEPEIIPDDWHPNGLHVNHGMSFGLAGVTAVGADFKAWAQGEGVKSSDWDEKFMVLLQCKRDNDNPERIGFDNLGEYARPGSQLAELCDWGTNAILSA